VAIDDGDLDAILPTKNVMQCCMRADPYVQNVAEEGAVSLNRGHVMKSQEIEIEALIMSCLSSNAAQAIHHRVPVNLAPFGNET
jgi:hypothetical protein